MKRRVLMFGVLLVPLLLAGCAGTPESDHDTGFDHVVIILEENKPAVDVMGNAAASYLNELAASYATATNYSAITNPSLPNYLALTSGTTGGITTDCTPNSENCQVPGPNLADRVEASGRTWRMYAEGMPEPCAMESAGRYAVKHVPFLYYPSVTDDTKRCASHVVPFSDFAHDMSSAKGMPDLSIISPDLCNDMHDCSIETGDRWLAREVPKILASTAFTKNSLLVVTFDEGNRSDNTISLIFAGPAAKKHAVSKAPYNHYSLLHTIEASWQLKPLTTNDREAPLMSDLLKSR
jgi:phospholipase C